ncbi:MAG: autotransporter-associated beta strand repeat-containing protein [Verrucomicrobiota bacterium]
MKVMLKILMFVWLVPLALRATPPAGYYLVWADEFNGASLDTTKWNTETGARREAINTPAAVSLNGSNLVITTYTSGGMHYSAFVQSAGKFHPRYGYTEASIKWSDSPGMWSAYWMWISTMTIVGDVSVNGAEMDVCEHRLLDGTAGNANINNIVQSNYHWDGYGADHKSVGSGNIGSGLGTGFHTYALRWDASQYRMLIDDVQKYSTTSANSDRSEYIIFSSEVDDSSTTWAGTIPVGGYGDLVTSTTKMSVDYVRFFAPTTTVYFGGAASGAWTNAANWVAGMTPQSGNDVVFSYLSTNNLITTPSQTLTLNSIAFLETPSSVTVTGNVLTIGAGGIDVVSAVNDPTIASKISLNAAQTWKTKSARTLNVLGEVTGSPILTLDGYGTVQLLGSNSFTGKLIVAGGTLVITNESGLGANPGAFTADKLTLDGMTLRYGGIGAVSNVMLKDGNRGITLGAGGGTIQAWFTISNVISGAGDLTVFKPEKVFVAVTGGGSVRSYDSTTSGNWVDNGNLIPPGTYGAGILNSPFGLAVRGTNLYVAEAVTGGRILEFNTAGNYMRTISTFAASTTPRYLGFGPDGYLYMSDAFGTSGDNVWRVDVTNSTASIWIPSSFSGGSFNNPQQMAWAADGNFYIGDRQNNVIRKFNSSGTFVGNLASITAPLGLEWDAASNRLLTGAGFTEDISSVGLDGSATNYFNGSSTEGVLSVADIGGDIYYTRFSAGSSTPGVYRVNSATSASKVTGSEISANSPGQMIVLPTSPGIGTLSLCAANTFSGDTRIGSGTLILGHANALQNSTLDMNVADSGNFNINNLNAQIGGLSGTRDVSLGSGAVTIGGNGSNTVYSGSLSGNGTLTKSGIGSLSLSGSNTFSGPILVSSGYLVIGSSNALGAASGNTIIASGAEVRCATSGLNIAEPFTLSGATNGLHSTGGSGGTLTFSGAITLGGSSSLKVDGSAPVLSVNGNISLGANTLTVSLDGGGTSVIGGVISGTGALTKSGTGTLRLDNTNTFSGDTRIVSGTLTVNHTNALQNSTVNLNSSDSGALDMNNLNVRFGGLKGTRNLTLGNGNISIGNNNQSTVFAGSLSGTGSFMKIGNGTFTLAGSNSFVGGLVISAGTLTISNFTASGVVTVGAGATLAGGGILTGPVTVQNTGTISPGNSIGTMTISNALALSGVTFMELNKNSPTNDLIRGLSVVSYGGTLVLTNLAGTLAAGDGFKLFDAASYTGAFTNITPTGPGNGLAWDTSSLASNGVLKVVAIIAPQFIGISNSVGTVFQITASGTPGQTHSIYWTTNLALPFTQWPLLGPTTANGSGAISFTDAQATNTQRFYRLSIP